MWFWPREWGEVVEENGRNWGKRRDDILQSCEMPENIPCNCKIRVKKVLKKAL